MPFSSDFDNVYEFGIKGARVEAGAECQRVDEQIFVEIIMERIHSQIASADVIVADVTGKNPERFL
jgi:hypothetical protein